LRLQDSYSSLNEEEGRIADPTSIQASTAVPSTATTNEPKDACTSAATSVDYGYSIGRSRRGTEAFPDFVKPVSWDVLDEIMRTLASEAEEPAAATNAIAQQEIAVDDTRQPGMPISLLVRTIQLTG
jgi:hypothetical protein